MNQKPILFISILLAFVAGFSDATTFLGAGELFSAHVTGNFILFAYDVVKGAGAGAWIKLISFPVFIIAVIIAGRITQSIGNIYSLLFMEGIILLTASIIALVLKETNSATLWLSNLVAMMIVFALASQNAFGRIYSKATLGPTTVMTGNVTQAVLDLRLLFLRPAIPEKTKNFRNQLLIITGFLIGCLLGAYLSQQFGLCVVAVPAVIMVWYFYH
jgi:uncharacterized membrane protein YoaK (UPF0700 family)